MAFHADRKRIERYAWLFDYVNEKRNAFYPAKTLDSQPDPKLAQELREVVDAHLIARDRPDLLLPPEYRQLRTTNKRRLGARGGPKEEVLPLPSSEQSGDPDLASEQEDFQREVYESIADRVEQATKGVEQSFWHNADRPGEFFNSVSYQNVRQGLFHVLRTILSEHPDRIRLCACGCRSYFLDDTKNCRKRCLDTRHAARVRQRRRRRNPPGVALQPERNPIIAAVWHERRAEAQETETYLTQNLDFGAEMTRLIEGLEGKNDSHG